MNYVLIKENFSQPIGRGGGEVDTGTGAGTGTGVGTITGGGKDTGGVEAGDGDGLDPPPQLFLPPCKHMTPT